MEIKQSSIDEIIATEHELFLNAQKNYGKDFENAIEFNELLGNFLLSVQSDRWIFASFLGQVRKHSLLALFSIVRLHHTEAMMNIRQVLEAGSWAAYAIAHPNDENFISKDSSGIVCISEKLTLDKYRWLEKNFKEGSESMKKMKGLINGSSAHANILNSFNSFTFNSELGRLEIPFFDIKDDYVVKGDLWQLSNITMGLLDLFYGVNSKYNSITFKADFGIKLKSLEATNHEIKFEMMNSLRFKNVKSFI